MLAASLAGPVVASEAPPQAAELAVPAKQQEQRPNVLLWLMDDVGFAQLSSFGGLVETPNIDRVARMGLRYTNYRTTPVCSPARASLLTGRNAHSVHMGWHAIVTRDLPGYDGKIPPSAGSIAENLRQSGYATFAFGKWDQVPSEELSPIGPFRYWPTQQGFDHFYGFLAGDADNWSPILVRDNSPITTPSGAGYHLNNDLADQAIAMIRSRGGLLPPRPFLMYWATGTAHAPHHAPERWIEHYKGKFDLGWDRLREEILNRQKAEGIVPPDTRLAPRPDDMKAWNKLSGSEKKLYTRQMEVFAASLSYADEEFGRILDELEARGELDNTIVIVTSDNGASAEGGPTGLYNEAALLTGEPPTVEENLALYDQWGGPGTYPHYAFGWAVAGNTPFRFYKQTTHEGGIHVPLIVSWPDGIAGRGEFRRQFAHVSDITPTILELTGTPLAKTVNNVPQSPMEGTSFAYSFDNPADGGRRGAQYFEMFGNKGLYDRGWAIVTSHRMQAWNTKNNLGPPDEAWELYHLDEDPGEVRNFAMVNPAKVTELAQIFDQQARRFNVYPIGNAEDGLADNAEKARLQAIARKGVWRYSGPLGNIPPLYAPPVAFRSYVMNANLEIGETHDLTAPIFALGGKLGGLGLYLRDGKPVFIANTFAGKSYEVASERPLPRGAISLKLAFVNNVRSPDAEPSHSVELWANGVSIAKGVISFRIPESFGISETFGVGTDRGSTLLSNVNPVQASANVVKDVTFDFAQPAQ